MWLGVRQSLSPLKMSIKSLIKKLKHNLRKLFGSRRSLLRCLRNWPESEVRLMRYLTLSFANTWSKLFSARQKHGMQLNFSNIRMPNYSSTR